MASDAKVTANWNNTPVDGDLNNDENTTESPWIGLELVQEMQKDMRPSSAVILEDDNLLAEVLQTERFKNFEIRKANGIFPAVSKKETDSENGSDNKNENKELLKMMKSGSNKEQMELNEAMCIAVQKGKASILEMVLKAGADIHAFDDCYPILHTIVDMKNMELFKLAINHSKSLKIESKHGNLLSAAVRTGSLELVEEVYKEVFKGNSVEEYDSKTSFPLHEAVTNLQSEVKKLNGNTDLHKTSSAENITEQTAVVEKYELTYDLSILKYLVEIGCNVNKPGPKERMPLHIAALTGNIEVVNYLISIGATKHVFDVNKQTPFMIAAHFRHKHLYDSLIDINYIDKPLDTGESLLHYAISNDLVEALKFLLDQGADTNVLNSRNQTPLFQAISEGDFEGVYCIKTLLSHPSCDVWKTIDNENALEKFLSDSYYHRLHFREQRDEVLDIFVQRGLDVNEVYEDGNTLLTSSIDNYYSITEWILKNGGNPDYIKPNGEYPLYMVCERHRERETEILLRYNADVTLTSKLYKDKTPLIAALETKDYCFIKLCLEAGFSLYKVHNWLEENKNFRDQLWAKGLIRPFVHYIENRPYAPMSLRGLARIKVLKNLGHKNLEEKIKTLGLPSLMENFLIWEKYLDMREQCFENYKNLD